MKMVTINGKQYPVKEITFNDLCTFEEMGVDIQSIEKKPLSFLRVFIGITEGTLDLDVAGKEIEAHITNGGKLEDLLEAMTSAIEESGFFRTQQPTTKQATSKSEAKSENKEQ